MIRDRSRAAVGALLCALALFGASCESKSTRPDVFGTEPAHPYFLAVTAPDVAAPGADILVRVHWASWDCSVTFTGFDSRVDSTGTRVLEPRWTRSTDRGGCPTSYANYGREETTLLTMPAAGSLHLRVVAGARSVERTVLPGAPPTMAAWTIDAVELGSGAHVSGAVLQFFEATPTSSGPTHIAVDDTILVATTDSTGTLRAEIATPAQGHLFAFIAEHPTTHDLCAVPVVAFPPATQLAERMTLILDWARDSVTVVP